MFGYVFDLNNDQIYWLFSSSSQSIAAFIALLLTGYAFVVNVMDNLEARDETLVEVHSELKSTYYKQLKVLAIIGGSTIIASFVMIFVNYYSNWIRSALLIPSAIGIVSTVVIGVKFIVNIVDPKKYSKKATALLKEEEKIIQKEGTEISIGEFISSFIKLEKLIRDIYLQMSSKPVFSIDTYKRIPNSLVEIVDIFYKNKFINDDELGLLKEVIKTRNLVVHGQQAEIDSSWLKMLTKAIGIVENAGEEFQKRIIINNINELNVKVHNAENALERQRSNLDELRDKYDNSSGDSIKEHYSSLINEAEDHISNMQESIARMREKIEEGRKKVALLEKHEEDCYFCGNSFKLSELDSDNATGASVCEACAEKNPDWKEYLMSIGMDP